MIDLKKLPTSRHRRKEEKKIVETLERERDKKLLLWEGNEERRGSFRLLGARYYGRLKGNVGARDVECLHDD